MKPLHFDAINPFTGKPFTFDDPNLKFVNGIGVYLEPSDPDFVPYSTPAISKTKNKTRKYMASNPTPDPIDELIAAGEDMCDGLNQHAVALGITQNTFVKTRADLDALHTAVNEQSAAEGAQPAAYTALRTADSNGKGFIAAFIKIASITLGNDWSDDWLATGLPDNTVGVPTTQDKRFAALPGIKAYLTKNPTMEVSTPKVTVTAALADTLCTAISDARKGVNNALNLTKTKVMAKDDAETAFRKRYRGVIKELEDILADDDPKWYDFGLSRHAGHGDGNGGGHRSRHLRPARHRPRHCLGRRPRARADRRCPPRQFLQLLQESRRRGCRSSEAHQHHQQAAYFRRSACGCHHRVHRQRRQRRRRRAAQRARERGGDVKPT